MTPTGRDLYDRLCALLGAETDEELAVHLGMSARQVQRIKSGFGPNQQKLLSLLAIAGWLNPQARLSVDEARARAEVFQQARRLQRRAGRNSQGRS